MKQVSRTATVLERSVFLTLSRHWLGNHRSVETEDVVEAAGGEGKKVDGEQVKSTKRLVDSKALLPCRRILSGVSNYLRRKAIATDHIFGEGSYLIPLALADEVDTHLATMRTELAVEVELLAQKYEAEIEKQRVKLGPLFKREEYPSPDDVRRAYSFDWDYVSFAAPDKLETVDSAMLKRARDKYDARMAEAWNETRLALREMLRQLVADIVKKVTPGKDGKVKVFRNSVLDGLAEYLSTVKARNITDDKELDAVVKQLRNLTKGIDPVAIRDNESVRANVAKGLAEVNRQLDGLVVNQRRTFNFAA